MKTDGVRSLAAWADLQAFRRCITYYLKFKCNIMITAMFSPFLIFLLTLKHYQVNIYSWFFKDFLMPVLWYSELNCHMWHQHPIWELVHFRSSSLVMYPEKSSRRWFPPPMWKTRMELLAPGLGLIAPVHWGHLESGPQIGDFLFLTLRNQNIIFSPMKMAFFFMEKKSFFIRKEMECH